MWTATSTCSQRSHNFRAFGRAGTAREFFDVANFARGPKGHKLRAVQRCKWLDLERFELWRNQSDGKHHLWISFSKGSQFDLFESPFQK